MAFSGDARRRCSNASGSPPDSRTPSVARKGSISSIDWLIAIGATLAILGLVAAYCAGCTIERVVLFETSNYPAVVVTPSQRIGPS